MLSLFAHFLATLVNLYKIMIFIRILLTWIPSLDWRYPLFRFLETIAGTRDDSSIVCFIQTLTYS